ncbi:MAG: diphosphate--fructose-6-phosphate 1-phosphotransferase, partial [Clostridia bacterium]|nr:diphosphate--fructose-6-phosphate 1-phosphotransferase [Clostridia bacterium]
GIPKTIDNDLDKTDHCPGFASAAKYIATSMMEIYRDSTVYDYGQITVVEIMGRNAGWLTASAALASVKGQGPDLIYLPEKAFCLKDFLDQVEAIYKEKGKCLIAVSEGIRNRRGRLISDTGKVDSFGHPQLGGLAAILSEKINKRLNVKVRGIELSLLQRCAAHCASKTDIEESFAAGKAAVENAVAGVTDKMVGYKRRYVNGKYKCQIKLFELTDVANTEKKVPISWINKDNTGMSDKFIKYALPLIEGETELPKEDGLPRFVNLKKVLVKK